MITKEQQTQIKNTIGMLSSMVIGGENHSETSMNDVKKTIKLVNDLSQHFVSGCFSFAKHFKQNYEFHQYTTEGKETYITDTGVVRTEDEVMEHWKTYYR
jgi:hypothetical protein